jgi:Flp pilus assembly protein TadG
MLWEQLGYYRLFHRVSHEVAVVRSDSAEAACRSLGWAIGDVWVRPLKNPTPAQLEEERRLLDGRLGDIADRQGQSLVETAITLPLLCLLIIGGCCLALILSDRASLDFSARTAATWGAAHPEADTADICNVASQNLTMIGVPGAVECNVVLDGAVTVRLTYPERLPFFEDLVIHAEAVVPR